jgi:hypothetical protein
MPFAMQEPKAPKPAAPRTPAPKKAAAPEKSSREKRAEGLLGYGQIAELPLAMFGQFADVQTIEEQGPAFCAAIAEYCEAEEKAGAVIDKIVAAGPVAVLVTACLPLVLQFAVNHGIGKAGMMGTVLPELLEHRFLRGVKEKQEAAARDLAEMRAELAEMRAEDKMAESMADGE